MALQEAQSDITTYPLRLGLPFPLEVLKGVQFRLDNDGSLKVTLSFQLTKALAKALDRLCGEDGVGITIGEVYALQEHEFMELDPGS